MEHPLHKIIEECIDSNKFRNCKIIKDPACGGQHNVPLFCSEEKSRKTRYCIVDILIHKDDKIRVIIEIEESDVTPIRIFGKFFASALSSYYIYEFENKIPIGMSDSISFIQILDTSRLSEKSSKIEQWENLEKSIKSVLPINKIGKYELIYGNFSDFKGRNSNKCAELITCIKEALE